MRRRQRVLRAGGSTRRPACAQRIEGDDPDEDNKDQTDNQSNQQDDRRAGRIRRSGCGRTWRSRGISGSRSSGQGSSTPRVLQTAGTRDGGGIASGAQGPVDSNHLRNRIGPGRDGQRPVLVGRRRGRGPGCRRLHLSLDAQGDRGKGKRRTEDLAILRQGLVRSGGQYKLARVMDHKFRLVLGAAVHQLHVTDRRVIASHELDVVRRRAADARLTDGLTHRA